MISCKDCIHFNICSLWTTSDLIDDKAHLCCFGNYTNEKNYRKVADDEIVIKKSKYEQATQTMKAFDDICANGFVTLAKHHEIINQVAKETATEILQEFLKEFVAYACVGDYYTDTEIYNKIQELANKYGIELE